MVNRSEQGNYQGHPKEESKDDKKLKSILSNSKNLGKAKKIIGTLNRDSRQELKAILLTSGRNDYYELKEKLVESDVQKLLEIIAEEEEKITLLSTDELRPITWSKTVTVFDVYETDEENFVPYISPLATVGAVNTGGGSDSDIDDMAQTGDIGDVADVTGADVSGGGEAGQEESKGLLGLGFMGL